MTGELRRYTQSERGTWLRCRRKWWFGYYRTLQPRVATLREALAIGNVVHDVLASYYESNGQVDVPAELYWHATALADLFGDSKELQNVVDYSNLIVTGYLDWLNETGADAALEVIAPERQVEVPITINHGGATKQVALLGKMDLTVRDLELNGALTFMDHKTVGDLTSFPKWAHLAPQMLFYHLLHQLAYGETESRVEAGMYNLLRKSKRTARANPPFYKRIKVRHGVEQLRTFYQTTVAVIGEMEHAREVLDAGGSDLVLCPPSPQEDCYWSCTFFGACAMRDGGSSRDLEGYLEEMFVEGDPLARYGTENGTDDQTS